MKLEYKKVFSDESFLCEYYRVHDLTDIDEFLKEIAVLIETHQDHQFIMTLDDVGQASYTSGHTISSNELECEECVLPQDIDPSCIDDFLRRNRDFEQEFSTRRSTFQNGVACVEFEEVFEKDLSLTGETKEDFIEANANPLSMIDDEVYLLKVPVDKSYEAIYAFPNGYFTCDLSPFENYRLAEHLETEYGFHLFGIGASYLSFIKGAEFTPEKVDSLLELLAKIYLKEEDKKFMNAMKRSVLERRILVLRYTEG